jgi:hypothetical protein
MVLLAVVVLSISAAGLVALTTMGISYTSKNGNSDPEKQARTAAKIGEWKWPADMHKYDFGKALMKDTGVLLLVVMQRLLNDCQGFYPVVMVANVANALSAVLVFLTAQTYWGTDVGLILFALYLACLWTYMIVFYGGYQTIGQALILVSVYLFQEADAGAWEFKGAYVAAGMVFILSQFASASSRKYVPLYFAAFFYSQIGIVDFHWVSGFTGIEDLQTPTLAIGILIVALLLGLIVLRGGYKPMLSALYYDRIPGWVPMTGRFLNNKGNYPFDDYYQKAKIYIDDISYLIWCLVGLSAFCLFFFQASLFYFNLSLVLVGAGLGLFLFLYPNILKNIAGYYHYFTNHRWATHHSIHEAYYMQKIGHVISNGEGGWRWDIRFFWIMVPFIACLYVGSATLAYGYLVYESDYYGMCALSLMMLLSASGLIWGKISSGPQISPAYFPVLLGLLLSIGYACSLLQGKLDNTLMYSVIGGIVVLSIGWNLKEIATDILPSKMDIVLLDSELSKRNITNFYTYKTPYNEPFVYMLEYHYSGKYKVEYIESIDDVFEGYIVVPPTGENSVHFESNALIVAEGNFSKDPSLTELIESKMIADLAVASFKTFGSSKYWIFLSDDMSYRDLLFGEITEDDRFLGLGWLLTAERIVEKRKLDRLNG